MKIKRVLGKAAAGLAGILMSTGIGVENAMAEPIHVGMYNVYSYWGDSPSTICRIEPLKVVTNRMNSDVIAGMEFRSFDAVYHFLDNVLNGPGGPGSGPVENRYEVTYVRVNGGSIDSAIFYRPSKIEVINDRGTINTSDECHNGDCGAHNWIFDHLKIISEQEDFFIYVNHLDSSDNDIRVAEAKALRKHLEESRQAGDNIMVLGDFNIDRNFGTFVEHPWDYFTHPLSALPAGAGIPQGQDIRLVDPLNPLDENQIWRVNCGDCSGECPDVCATCENTSLRIRKMHTQSPVNDVQVPCGGAFAKGAMNDRFDFILVSRPIYTKKYSLGSYEALGNNGNYCCKAIHCPIGGADSLHENLRLSSDHVPVLAVLEDSGPRQLVSYILNSDSRADLNYDEEMNGKDIRVFANVALRQP